MSNNLKIMDCTLRDGSYKINFQFTAQDTFEIAQALDRTGVDLIEVGHGVGLGASQKGFGQAAATDIQYMEAAAKACKNAKWGIFSIPGIATLDDIKQAIDMGAGFIRVGANVNEVEKMRDFIEYAKSQGVLVCANFMKSYAISPDCFAEAALTAHNFGADYVYIVDSAGGMLQSEVEEFIKAVRRTSGEMKVGFHGHNNLGLAVSNSLLCAEKGCELIDTSLQGFGRSSGNAATEQVACALHRMGMRHDLQVMEMLNISEKYLRVLLKDKFLDTVDIISGYSQFHSSYMPTIKKYALEYQIDPRDLIVAVCDKNKLEAPEDLVADCAKAIHENLSSEPAIKITEGYFGREQ